MIRIPLAKRILPPYTRKQEIANMVTHIIGAGLGLFVLLCLVWFSAKKEDLWALFSGCVYGLVMIALYVVSSVYHGLLPSISKKVMQIIDHCSIYCLIAATYTPIALVAVRPFDPLTGWLLFFLEWSIAISCIVFSAIDLKRFRVLEMISYIVMGWLILLFIKPVFSSVGSVNFYWILAGGLAFTLGSVLYGLGKKNQNFHTVFHIFCVAGSAFQSVSVLRICGM